VKKTILPFLFSFLSFTTLMAQMPPVPEGTVNPNAAEITFVSEVHDYGTIKQNANGDCEFKFKNTGKEPLIITAASGSCGCTVPTAPLNTPILPGESGSIKVHYDTNRQGSFTKQVTLTSNAKTATKVLTIKGNVLPAPVEEPFPSKKPSGAPFE